MRLSWLFGALIGLAAPAAAESGDPVNGRLVVEHWCSTCHALSGTETDPDRAPTFSQIINERDRDARFLTQFLKEDHFPMTTYRLFENEKRDVVAFLVSLTDE